MTKLSLKNLELVITSQLFIDTLLIVAKRDIPTLNPETTDRAIILTKGSLGDLILQYEKRTNSSRTQRMVTRCQNRITVEETTNG